MAGSNLTNTFIANTYQKLLQYDNINGSVGTTAVFSMADAISSSKYNLLNGLGQTMPGFVIDTTGNGDGGLMFKDSNSDPGISIPPLSLGGLWSIQTFETSNSEAGLNFWRPSGVTNAANAKLFLKNTGSVWVGYQDSVNPTPVIPTDITGYSLYVKDGIYVTGSTPRIRMDNNSSQFLVRQNGTNGFSPRVDFPIHFLTVNFGQTNNSPENLDANLNIPVSDWNVAVIGTDWGNEGGGSPIVYTYINGSTWWVRADVIGDDDNDTVVNCQFLIVHKSVSSRVNNSLFGNSNGSNGSSSDKPFITYTGNTLHAAPGG